MQLTDSVLAEMRCRGGGASCFYLLPISTTPSSFLLIDSFSPTLISKSLPQDNINTLHIPHSYPTSHAYILHHALLSHSPCFRCCCSCKFHHCLAILPIFMSLCHIRPDFMMASKINSPSSTFPCLSLSSCQLGIVLY